MNEELARQLCLKVIYGGELTSEETPVFESFVQTDTGQQYLSRSREMKDTLNNIANVELVAEDQSAMINRFENLLKQNAIESQKKFPLAVSLLIGPISVLLLISMLTFGWTGVTPLLIGALAIFGFLAIVLWKHNQRLMNEENVYELMTASHIRSRELPSRVVALLMPVLPAILAGWGFYQFDGPESGMKYFTLCLVFTLGVTWLLTTISKNSSRSGDPEVWDWWQDGLKD
ncbi:MAG: hypothetical protein VX304_04790 [Planctomycetota bacterium]|nr:hypothetical protein [Planctomycetota bacterium]MEE3364940.1 hypothetical protein [Planctomycetota bacterium]